MMLENVKITICGEHVKVVEKEHHSGHVLGTKKDLTSIDPSIQDMKMKTNTIVNQFNSIPPLMLNEICILQQRNVKNV